MIPTADALARRFRVIERIGEGAFGTVYLAEMVGTGVTRQVAIKVPHPDRMSGDVMARLRDEARLGALIRHRAIVRVDDLVEVDGTWAVVMEYVEGCDLAELLAAGPVPPRAALAIAEEVAQALHAAWHQPGPDGTSLQLVHRDVKPSNLRVTPAGEVKLLDFGVARARFDTREVMGTGAVLGTHTYLAPERFEGRDVPAGDVYALGVTLFELLTGAPPGKSAFDADRQPPGRRYAEQWRWLGTVHPELPGLLARFLAPRPEDRPGAREAARALAAIAVSVGGLTLEDWAEQAVPARRRPGDRTPPMSGSLRLERGSTSMERRGRRAWLVGVGLGLLGVVGVGGAWLANRPAEPGPPSPALAAPVPPAVAPAPVPTALPAATPVVAAPVVVPVEPVAAEPELAFAPSPVEVEPTPRSTGPRAPTGERTAAPRATSRAPTTGSLVLSGDVGTVELSPAGSLSALAPGSYRAVVRYPDGTTIDVDGIEIVAGAATTLKCSAKYLRCTPR